MNLSNDSERARGDLGRRVARRRAELGLSQEKLAELAGMAAGYIDYLERNPPNLSRGALDRLAEALRTSPEALLGADFDEPAGAHGTRVPLPRLRALDSQECMELISAGGVGRVAFTVPGESAPTVLPVNFLVAGDGVVFRTAAHGAIARYAASGQVSFQVDRLDGAMSEGWSVLVVGRARPVYEPAELSALRATAPVQPWAPGERDLFIMIVPARVTGRRVENEAPL
ncbi:helix-turn-helix domain-containing protein [Actinorugispora endophytica]|uniref:Nitroimidazol reductase NimA-like FMN-containing flavoprotein (Pyridoxamine 5'-phosphate oxidase superfamily) n=1 Tax=Actinorugispora endophytica TaxID=1605990 RepID=A0A4R6V192_9ACTN|nr:pyridoxamine 5'-phosphate oxidase family protein [Actinorugispora endophytica]TDQ52288.1 nitroimidazol reductase NimA-like FMN-containing flavoprotein (pyridoxamine 5'-phosphate oxidase superfamily) [Actinorugispora endophytica]